MKTAEQLKTQLLESFREKYVSEWKVDDGTDTMLWNTKAPSPNDVLEFLSSALSKMAGAVRKEVIKKIDNQRGDSSRLKPERVRRPSMQGDFTKAVVWQEGYDDACDDILQSLKRGES